MQKPLSGLVLAVVLLGAILLQGGATVVGATPGAQACYEFAGNPVVNGSQPYFAAGNSTEFAGYSTLFDGISVVTSGSGYSAWLAGTLANVSGIFHATSTNGIAWSIGSSPVLSTGAGGSWDSVAVYSPSVVYNGTGYMMYFSGSEGTAQSRSIGVAFSADGVKWVPYASNPIIKGGSEPYDAYYARFPSVIYENGTYEMWYTGHNALNASALSVTINYATSKDGVHWTKYSGNPVLTQSLAGVAGFTANDSFAEYPSVIRVNGAYVMFFDNGTSVKYAFAANATSWTSEGVALNPGGAGPWDNGSVLFPAAAVSGSAEMVWFFGLEATNPPYLAPVQGIGLAICPLEVFSMTQTSTTTQTVTFTRYSTYTSTSISTSIATATATQSVTVVSNPNASFFEVATAFVIGAAIALAGAVAMIAFRLRGRMPPKS